MPHAPKQLITPEEARRLSDGGVDKIVDRIDNAIRAAAGENRWPCTIDVGHVNRRALGVALQRFVVAGWRITVVTDARDGDFIQVEAP